MPLSLKLESIFDGAISHAWILARIAFIFKTTEEVLRQISGKPKPTERHSFVAGCLAGFLVMATVRDSNDYRLKQQVNMFIAMRTMWAVAKYAMRKDLLVQVLPFFSKDDDGRR